jgi:Sulfotransferase family
MSDSLLVHSKPSNWPSGTDALHTPRGTEKWLELSSHAILILGSPRSGTSWLAKIFDSHPEVLYRHEPDEVASIPARAQPTSQLLMLLMERHVRAAAKRPWFRKTWRPYHREILRHALAAGISLAERVQLGKIMGFRLPDMIALASWGRVRAAVKLVNWDGSHIADRRWICCNWVASWQPGMVSVPPLFRLSRQPGSMPGNGARSMNPLPSGCIGCRMRG